MIGDTSEVAEYFLRHEQRAGRASADAAGPAKPPAQEAMPSPHQGINLVVNLADFEEFLIKERAKKAPPLPAPPKWCDEPGKPAQAPKLPGAG